MRACPPQVYSRTSTEAFFPLWFPQESSTAPERAEKAVRINRQELLSSEGHPAAGTAERNQASRPSERPWVRTQGTVRSDTRSSGTGRPGGAEDRNQEGARGTLQSSDHGSEMECRSSVPWLLCELRTLCMVAHACNKNRGRGRRMVKAVFHYAASPRPAWTAFLLILYFA